MSFCTIVWHHCDAVACQIGKNEKCVVQLSPCIFTWNITWYGVLKRSVLTLGANKQGLGQICSQPWSQCDLRPSILLWSLKMMHKKLWVFTNFKIDLNLDPIFPKMKSAWAVIDISHHTQFKNDVLKTVDDRLLTNKQTELITYSLPSRGEKIQHF